MFGLEFIVGAYVVTKVAGMVTGLNDEAQKHQDELNKKEIQNKKAVEEAKARVRENLNSVSEDREFIRNNS
jgi:hypothetical protein